MHNDVVLAAVRGCLDAGWSALRFNFGGVGSSGGRYSGGAEEVDDAIAAAAALRDALPAEAPLAVIGYSFGAWVGAQAAVESAAAGDRNRPAAAPSSAGALRRASRPSLTVIVGDRDRFCPRDRLEALLASTRAEHVVLAGADHFLAGRDDELTAAVRAAWAPADEARAYSLGRSGAPVESALRQRLEGEGFDVWCWSDAPGAHYAPHSHDHDESLWIVDGEITFGAAGAELHRPRRSADAAARDRPHRDGRAARRHLPDRRASRPVARRSRCGPSSRHGSRW